MSYNIDRSKHFLIMQIDRYLFKGKYTAMRNINPSIISGKVPLRYDEKETFSLQAGKLSPIITYRLFFFHIDIPPIH